MLKIISSKKWHTRLGLALLALVTLTYGLACWHNQRLVWHPVYVWHSANMAVHSTWAGKQINKDHLSNSNAALTANQTQTLLPDKQIDSANTPSPEQHPAPLDIGHAEMQNLLAEQQAVEQRLQADLGHLNEINRQLLTAQANRNAMRQDFANIAQYQQQQAKQRADRQAELDALLVETGALPTPAQAKALLNDQTKQTHGRSANRLSPQVLNNIQRTTGISSTEINQLMQQ